MTIDEKTEVVLSLLAHMGRLLSGSKSSYSQAHPNDQVFFNGNIYDSKGNKLWYGDVNLTKEKKVLDAIADQIGETIYVTRESPYRWSVQTTESLEKGTIGKHPDVVKFG